MEAFTAQLDVFIDSLTRAIVNRQKVIGDSVLFLSFFSLI